MQARFIVTGDLEKITRNNNYVSTKVIYDSKDRCWLSELLYDIMNEALEVNLRR